MVSDPAKAIESANAVVGIIGSENQNVLFELGCAMALRKPVLVLVVPGAKIPHFLQNITYLTTELLDTPVLRLGIKQFLDEASHRPKGSRTFRISSTEKRGNPSTLRALIGRVKHLRNEQSPIQAEALVGELLRLSLTSVVEEAGSSGVDFAVWDDSLTALGNPVLIEVKASNLNPEDFQEAYNKLATQVQRSDARAGLFLYLDLNNRRFTKPTAWAPNVLWFDLEDFANSLLHKSFAEILVEQRNKTVHGLIS
jgi:hypothetical protein